MKNFKLILKIKEKQNSFTINCMDFWHEHDKLTKLLNEFLRLIFVLNKLSNALINSVPLAASIKLSIYFEFLEKTKQKNEI